MSTESSFDDVSVVPVAPSVPLVAGDEAAMREWAEAAGLRGLVPRASS